MHSFYGDLSRTVNSRQSRSVVLHGNVHDLFFDGEQYVPLIPFLVSKVENVSSFIQIVYEINGPIRIIGDRAALKAAWVRWMSDEGKGNAAQDMLDRLDGKKASSAASEFEARIKESLGNVTLAFEFMRVLTVISRQSLPTHNLLIYIESADMLLPTGGSDVSSLRDHHLRRIYTINDWFSDPAFMNGQDSVVLIADSPSLIHQNVTRLPQLLSVEVPSPDLDERLHFVQSETKGNIESIVAEDPQRAAALPRWVASLSAGLSLHAVRQLLRGTNYDPTAKDVVTQVETFIRKEIGEDVIEFKKPEHTLDSVVGNNDLKTFLREELIPRIQGGPEIAIPGAAVAGSIGSGKTFIFEAVAAELGLPVLVLKNLRSQWYGQTDVIFEKLRRCLEALKKAVIFVDEADTQFGRVDKEAHSTERRLTGKIQAMMSDPKLKGRVVWLLMTARINQLSPDIRRPGRVGDLIIPVFDPVKEDRKEFIRWVVEPSLKDPAEIDVSVVDGLTKGYSAAAFATLRSNLKAVCAMRGEKLTMEDMKAIIIDQLPPDIGETREYQEIQALINCTRRSLLPEQYRDDPEKHRDEWRKKLLEFEAEGIA